MDSSRLTRRTLVALALILLVWPFAFLASQRAVSTMFNAPLTWISPEFAARKQFDAFVERFKSREMILVSWDGCTIDDPRLKELGDALRDPSDPQQRREYKQLFVDVVTGYGLVRELNNEALGLTAEEAAKRLEGVLVGPDGKTSCAVVVLHRYDNTKVRDVAISAIEETASRVVGIPASQLHLAGPAIDGRAIDAASVRSIDQNAIPSTILSLILCWICLRSIWLTLPVMAVAAFGQTMMLASVAYTGATMNAVLIVLPPLILVLTVSAGVHLVNYYTDELTHGSREGAASRAIAKAWWPCGLAAATTAIGMASLLVSEIEPVQRFGGTAAVGVLGTFAMLFLLVPGALQHWPGAARRQAAQTATDGGSWLTRFDRAFWGRAAEAIAARSNWIVISCFTLLAVTSIGLARIHTSVDVGSLLLPSDKAIQDYNWFEEHIGPLVPVEIVLHVKRDSQLNLLDQVELLRNVQAAISDIDILDGTMSAATFAPDIPQGSSIRDVVRRTGIRKEIEQSTEQFVNAHYLHETPEQRSWRISARVEGHVGVDYGYFLDVLRHRVEPVIDQLREDGETGLSVTYTGVTPVVYNVQRALLSDLFDSFVMALALVALVMIGVLHGVRAGLLAMVPNVFPAGILFGTMGWLGMAVDIGSVMTASVELGIAVDGTIHYLTWFRREVDLGHTPREAIELAYRHCGRALAQTTVICAMGLLVLAISRFVPARNFAWMMFALLFAALLGDLVLLPAMLVGPLGRWFVKDPNAHKQPSREAPQTKREAGAETPVESAEILLARRRDSTA